MEGKAGWMLLVGAATIFVFGIGALFFFVTMHPFDQEMEPIGEVELLKLSGRASRAIAADYPALVEEYAQAVARAIPSSSEEGMAKLGLATVRIIAARSSGSSADVVPALSLMREVAEGENYSAVTRGEALFRLAENLLFYEDFARPVIAGPLLGPIAERQNRLLIAMGIFELSNEIFPRPLTHYRIAELNTRYIGFRIADKVYGEDGKLAGYRKPDKVYLRNKTEQYSTEEEKYFTEAEKHIAAGDQLVRERGLDAYVLDRDFANYEKMNMYRYKGLAKSGLYFLKPRTYTEEIPSILETFEEGLSLNTGSSNLSMQMLDVWNRFAYTRFLAFTYGGERGSHIQEVMDPLFTPAYQQALTNTLGGILDKQAHPRTYNTSGAFLIAPHDSRFKDYLFSLGWDEEDLKNE